MLILSRKFWPKLVKGLLDGSHLFLACQLFYKLVQPMPFLKRWGKHPCSIDLFISPEMIGAISEPACFKNFGGVPSGPVAFFII